MSTDDGLTQRKPIVFISYSGYEGVVQQVVDALVKALRANGFEPEWDRERIGLGGEVKREVDAMIERCDAAIVVVGERALEHDNRWVFAESRSLTRLPGSVTVVPVYVDRLEPGKMPKSWDATGLPQLASYVVMHKSRRAMTKAIVKALEGARQVVQASAFERELRDYLTGRDVDVDTLKRAAQPIAGDPPRWSPGDLALQVALRLLKESLDPAWRTYLNLARLIALQRAQDCASLGLPFTWVDREIAGRIGRALSSQTPVALDLPHESVRICEAYVHCGWPTFPRWVLYDPPPAWDGTTAALQAHVEATLQGHAANNLIRRGRGASLGAVLAVPCPGLDHVIIRAARAAVANDEGVGLVFLAGDADWPAVPQDLRDQMTYERIAIDELHEDGVWYWTSARIALCHHRHQVLGEPSLCA